MFVITIKLCFVFKMSHWDAHLPKEKLELGVVTATAGNMAQGVAWNAQRLGILCTARGCAENSIRRSQFLCRVGLAREY
jgi:hypothetical protein